MPIEPFGLFSQIIRAIETGDFDAALVASQEGKLQAEIHLKALEIIPGSKVRAIYNVSRPGIGSISAGEIGEVFDFDRPYCRKVKFASGVQHNVPLAWLEIVR